MECKDTPSPSKMEAGHDDQLSDAQGFWGLPPSKISADMLMEAVIKAGHNNESDTGDDTDGGFTRKRKIKINSPKLQECESVEGHLNKALAENMSIEISVKQNPGSSYQVSKDSQKDIEDEFSDMSLCHPGASSSGQLVDNIPTVVPGKSSETRDSLRKPKRKSTCRHQLNIPSILLPQLCCFHCQRQEQTLCFMLGKNSDCDSLMTDHKLGLWVGGCLNILKNLAGCFPIRGIDELLHYVRDNKLFPSKATGHFLSPNHLAFMRIFDLSLGTAASNYSVSPPTSLGCLLHWFVLERIISSVPTHCHSRLVNLEVSVPHPLPAVATIDSHCHLDMVYDVLRAHSLPDVARCTESVDWCPLEFIVASFCFPRSWQRFHDFSTHSNVYYCFGIHLHVHETQFQLSLSVLEDLLSLPKCVALGEIELDFQGDQMNNSHSLQRQAQLTMLGNIVPLAIRYKKPIVLHVQGSVATCLQVMWNLVPRSYFLYLQRFQGTVEDVKSALKMFPNIYFGVGMKLMSEAAKKVLQALPLDRILLETDAPIMMRTPFSLNHVVVNLAEALNLPPLMIKEIGKKNALQFFQ